MDSFYHNRKIPVVFLWACLFLIPLLVYFPVLRSEYVAYDDELLLVDNVKAEGLTWEHVKQAFTTYDPELYIPLTLLTEQIEYTIVGHWNPAVSHGISLVLHIANVFLVFWLVMLLRIPSPLGGGLGRGGQRNSSTPSPCPLPWGEGNDGHHFVAFIVALLWALHPLNVEAVAWAAARKDLLSGFFFLLSLVGYLQYRKRVILSSVEGRHARVHHDTWYWCSITAFLLGLLAKVSIAPLPLVLLLLEWSLPHHPLPLPAGRSLGEGWKGEGRVRILKRISPFFLLSLIFVMVALFGKKAQVHAFGVTLLAPFIAIPFYLQKLCIPTGLSILYPFMDELSLIHPSVLVGVGLVGSITGLAWWSLQRTRGIAGALGILLLLLAPSFLNVARRGDGGIIDLYIASDRYMYLAMLGPLFLLSTMCASRRWVSYVLLPVLGVFAFLTVRQVGVWHDSEALFRNVLAQHQASHIAANNLAGFLAKKGEIAEAVRLYQQSIAIRENPRALFNLGRLLISEKRFAEALPFFEHYVAMKPRDAFGQMQLGGLYLLQDDAAVARPHLEQAVARDPNLTEAHYLLGVALEQLGDRTRAQKEFQETLRLEPNHPHAQGKLGG